MFRGSSILLVLALVLLTVQSSYATYRDYDDYDREHGVLASFSLGCIDEGRSCRNRESDCCVGLTCNCKPMYHRCICQRGHIF